jgi:hypothetical protein
MLDDGASFNEKRYLSPRIGTKIAGKKKPYIGWSAWWRAPPGGE